MCIIIHTPNILVKNFLNIFSKNLQFFDFITNIQHIYKYSIVLCKNNKPINRFIIYLVVFGSQIIQLYLPRQNDLGEFPPSQVYLLSNRVDLDHTQLILFGVQE